MTPQQIVILSYQREYRIQHRCDPHPTAKNDSDLRMKVVASEEEAVNFIVKRLCSDSQASFLHVIFTSWQGFVQFSQDQLPDLAKAKHPHRLKDGKEIWNDRQSIWVARPEIDYDSEWWEELVEMEGEAQALEDRIHEAVNKKLIEADAPTAVLKKASV